jgi:hypothetical protein
MKLDKDMLPIQVYLFTLTFKDSLTIVFNKNLLHGKKKSERGFKVYYSIQFTGSEMIQYISTTTI